MKHFAGNCHVYVDRSSRPEMAEKIVVNAKCQRLGVCNAAESLLVHADAADRFCRGWARCFRERGVELRGDEPPGNSAECKAGQEADFATEYWGRSSL